MSRLVPNNSYFTDDDYIFPPVFNMYSSEFWNFEKSFVALDGLNSGIPTRTTPTLTPTTLRNIEQTFLELTSETAAPAAHTAQAGFVPPVIHPTAPLTHQVTASGGSVYESKGGWGGGSAIVSRPLTTPSPALSNSPIPHQPRTRRNMGGRRPIKDDKISPEEQERRQVRRERNKLAAARCRKRRLDHTNELLLETEGLEQKKQCLQGEIQQLQREKEDLEFILEAHKPCCRLMSDSPPDVKPSRAQLQQQLKPMPKLLPVQNNNNNNNHQQQQHQHHHHPPPPQNHKPAQRPSSLPVAAFTPAKSVAQNNNGGTGVSEIAGIPITTPSAGIPFNFDSLMDGGTGLTPVTHLAPSCSNQQRNGAGDIGNMNSSNHHQAADLTSPDRSLVSL